MRSVFKRVAIVTLPFIAGCQACSDCVDNSSPVMMGPPIAAGYVQPQQGYVQQAPVYYNGAQPQTMPGQVVLPNAAPIGPQPVMGGSGTR